MTRMLVAGMAAALLAACGSVGGQVATLRELPLLEPPAGAEELGRIEAEGTTVGTGSPARVEVVWGVEDMDSAEAHVAEHGVAWDFRATVVGEWTGGRPVDGQPVSGYVRTWEDLDAVDWDSVVIDREELDPWAGPVVVVRVSTS
ncbi:hypothetical protein [Salsipaludibacter albus]|uniref:hypothetical protein n=1 Tax=Salsipaludibacter albus TaxID=2849650 RepID=UPI001EE4844A|nr:hypothetical protein [Salsipaludibacter albus]MBY5161496.1 hypothetical protein [Salsipaludibacter albus]